jgi:hypothetical protein
MATQIDEQTATKEAQQSLNGNGNGNGLTTDNSEYPYLGRSVRLVGRWESVDASVPPREEQARGAWETPVQLVFQPYPEGRAVAPSPFPSPLPTSVIPCRMR